MEDRFHEEQRLERLIQQKENEYDVLLRRSIMESSAELELKEQELALLRKSIDECRTKRHAEEQRFFSLERSIEERTKELQSKVKQLASIQRQLNFYCHDIEAKERECGAMRRSIEERNGEFESKGEELKKIQEQISECERKLRVKEEECNWQHEMMQKLIGERHEVHKKMQREIEECEKDLGAKKSRLCLIEDLIKEREQELRAKDMEFHRVVDDKEEELGALSRRIAECTEELKRKEEELDAMQKLVDGEGKEVELKRKNFFNSMRETINQLVCEVRSNKKESDALKRLMKERSLQLEGVKDLELKEKQLKERLEMLGLKEKQFEGRVKELESKEKQFEGRVKELESKEKQLEGQTKELMSNVKQFEGHLKLKSNVKQFEGRVKEQELKEKEFEGRVKEQESKEKQYEERVKELESKEKQYEERVQELKSKEKKLEGRVKQLKSNERQYVERVQELKSKQKQFQIDAKEIEAQEKQFEGQLKDLESKKNQYEGQAKELELKETQFKMQLKELESKKKQLEGQVNDLESKQNQFERQLKELELKVKQYESLRTLFEEEKVLKEKFNVLLHQVKTEQLYFKDAKRENNSKNLLLLFNLLKKYDLLCGQVSDALRTSDDPAKLVLDAMKCFYTSHLRQELAEYDANMLRRICDLLMDELKKSSPVASFHLKEEAMKFANDWKVKITLADKDCLEVLGFLKFVATYELGSSLNANELQRLLDIIAQHCQCQAPQARDQIEKLPDNQLSPTADVINLQLLSNEQTNEPELIGNDIIANLRTSSDPAEHVLDIIRNHGIPQNRSRDKGVIIDVNHIFLLEQLMSISPYIKPHVREEAMKLALDLKAKMGASTENSLVVLGFLLLLFIYGLVSSFDEDEILKLFEFAAQHKQAVDLFRTLGFADKISDFVQNLIRKQRHIGAVRFICVYKLADKIQPVDLLRQCMQKAKLISKRYGNKNKSIEKKIKARDKEIARLGAILHCVSDNNLESQDLVKEIHDRIVVLERQKENMVRIVSEPSLKVEVQQSEESKRPNEPFTNSQAKVQQPKEKKRAKKAVTKNPVEVEQPVVKVCANEAVTMNQVKVERSQEMKANGAVTAGNQGKEREPEEKKRANEAVTMNQVVQQSEEKKRANEAVTVNQVVQQSEEKKHAHEAVTNNHQSQESGNNSKRRRTATTSSVPSVFTPQYQHVYMPCHAISIPGPSGTAAQFAHPSKYYSLTNPMVGRLENSGPNYLCHSGPYPHFS